MIYIKRYNRGGSGSNFATGVVTDIHTLSSETSIKIWWDDPDDRYWAGTKLVKKESSCPENPDDGQVLLDSTVRDQYKYSSDEGPCYEDKGLSDSKTYYYALFPYSRKEEATIDDSEKFTASTKSSYFTVTFMNGQTLWQGVSVKRGETAVCTKGNPTKASDDNYDYSFAGWASSDGKEAGESGILNNITSDKTVYAAYSRARNSFTVTFMNGSVVWDTVKVKKGQNAVCSKGDPSKAEDESYTYSFLGWNSQDGQESAESGVLNNITSDKTVYAAYEKKGKTAAVTWKDHDGKVLKTEQLQLGTVPSYSDTPPTFHTFAFKGWTPTPSALSGPMTYYPDYAYPTGMSETIHKSWEEIIADGNSGNTEGYKNLDTKIMITTDDKALCFEIAGMKVDDLASGGKATFTFISRTTYGVCRWSSSAKNTGGYLLSAYKSYLEETCLNLFPANIKSALKSVSKTYRMGAGESGATNTANFKIWAPSVREINDPDAASRMESDGVTYTVYNSDNRRIRYDESGRADGYWLRSAYYYNTTGARDVLYTGAEDGNSVGTTNSALPCFCL